MKSIVDKQVYLNQMIDKLYLPIPGLTAAIKIFETDHRELILRAEK